MELVVPPRGIESYLIPAGIDNSGPGSDVDAEGSKGVRSEVVSELGIYGRALPAEMGVRECGDAGWVVRMKSVENNKGGIGAGGSGFDGSRCRATGNRPIERS